MNKAIKQLHEDVGDAITLAKYRVLAAARFFVTTDADEKDSAAALLHDAVYAEAQLQDIDHTLHALVFIPKRKRKSKKQAVATKAAAEQAKIAAPMEKRFAIA